MSSASLPAVPLSPETLGLVALLAVATATDLWRRRVPWWLTRGGICAGIAVAASSGGATLVASLLGVASGAVFLPLVALGWLGGADVLLLMVVGAWRGWHFALTVALWTAIAGGVLGIVAWLRGQRSLAYVPAIAIGTLLALARA